MATFFDKEYEKEVFRLESYFDGFQKAGWDDSTGLLSSEESVFFDKVTYSAWKEFYSIFVYNKDLLEENTEFNRKFLGNRVNLTLEHYKNSKNSFLSILLRLIYEYHFWLNDSSVYPESLNSRVLDRLDKIVSKENDNAQFLWIERAMPSSIAREFLQRQGLTELKKLQSDINNYKEEIPSVIESSKTSLNSTLSEKIIELNTVLGTIKESKDSLDLYSSKLDEYKKDYNFVLLSKAFKSILDKKQTELMFARSITWFFTLLLCSIPVITLLNHKYVWLDVGVNMSSLAYYIPMATLEIVIFYFMRLYYGEVRSIKTQMLQLEHRLSLCEFIHDYVEKRHESPSDSDSESWKSFESLIFSPIQMSAENIPSVLDGANVVADLAGKIVSKGK